MYNSTCLCDIITSLRLASAHGVEPTGEKGYSIPGRAEYATAVIKALLQQAESEGDRVERLIVLGHSFGGPVAMHVCAQLVEEIAAGDVRSLGALRPRDESERIAPGAIALALVAPVGMRIHKGIKSFPKWVLANVDKKWFRPLLGRVLKKGYKMAGFWRASMKDSFVATRYLKGHRFADVRDVVPRLHGSPASGHLPVPTYCSYVGGGDHLIEGEIFRELSEALPPGPRVVFESGGHNLQRARVEALARTLCDGWLRREERTSTVEELRQRTQVRLE